MGKFLTTRLNRLVQFGLPALAAALLLAPGAAQATPYIVKLVQQGSNVIAVGNGSLDLTGLVDEFNSPAIGPLMHPDTPLFIETGPGSVEIDFYGGSISGPSSFGPGGNTSATGGSQDEVALQTGGAIAGVAVPHGYSSGSTLSSTAVWDNATFASLGVTPGTYVWTWGSGAADESFTIMIGGTISAPEPAALGMFGLGVLLIGAFVGLRRRTA